MCYAIPGKVKSIEGKTATIEYFGETRRALNEKKNLKVGDYVYAQGGYILEVISEKEAKSILEAWRETFFALQDTDVRLAKIDMVSTDKKFTAILDRALEGKTPSRDELVYILKNEDKNNIELLAKAANFIRQKYLGNSCCVHGIIEISNICAQTCGYCGISGHNEAAVRYRMAPDAIVDWALFAKKHYGFKALVLQSGEDRGYGIDELVYVVRSIKEKAEAFICISFGEVGLDNLEKFYAAGARAMLLRFETSNPALYEVLKPGCRLESRLDHLKRAYELGFLTMTGGMVGLPGQTVDDLAGDILLARDLHAEMFSFGPFVPHAQTPLGGNSRCSGDLMLKVLAAARLIEQKNAKVLVTTAYETIDAKARERALMAGANSVMLNITPLEYRKLYDIYPERAHALETIEKQIEDATVLLRSLGRAPTDLSVGGDS
jgi:biotin synthase